MCATKSKERMWESIVKQMVKTQTQKTVKQVALGRRRTVEEDSLAGKPDPSHTCSPPDWMALRWTLTVDFVWGLWPWVKYRQSVASPPIFSSVFFLRSLSTGFSSLPIRHQRERVGGEEMESRNVSETLNRVRLCVLSKSNLSDFPLLHSSPPFSSSSHLLYIRFSTEQ